MSSSRSILVTIAQALLDAVTPRTSRPRKEPGRSAVLRPSTTDAGRSRGRETVRLDPEHLHDVVITYAPDRDGAPDAGEIVWTWVPFEEGDGRGKDRPVLVIGRESADRVFAVRMTSRPHEGDRDYLSIGSGEWDSQGRESWVDVEQLYSVHDTGMRREAAVLARSRFDRVAVALRSRYGWRSSH